MLSTLSIKPNIQFYGIKKWTVQKCINNLKYLPNNNYPPNGDVFGSSNPVKKVIKSPNYKKIKLDVSSLKDERLKELSVTERLYEIADELQPESYVYTDINGVKRLKPHLYIESVKVKPEFARQGACSDAEQKIIELSKQRGFEGRVKLYAARSFIEPSIIPSPSLAHWKNGFRFTDELLNQDMLKVLNGEKPLTAAPQGEMYYPV